MPATYILEGREIPDRPFFAFDEESGDFWRLDVHPAACIFCGRETTHVNDGGTGWILGSVLPDGRTGYYFYCQREDCNVRDAVWRCGCEDYYVESVGDYCQACLRPRKFALPHGSFECLACGHKYDRHDRDGIEMPEQCPKCGSKERDW